MKGKSPMLMTAGVFAAKLGGARSVDWIRQRADRGDIPCQRDSADRRMFDERSLVVAQRLIAATDRWGRAV
jgi:hypothetical protein